jgi:hypothetical protein
MGRAVGFCTACPCGWARQRQGLRGRVIKHRSCIAQGRRGPGNPRELGFGELLEVGVSREGIIRDEIGGARDGLQPGHGLIDDLTERFHITSMPTERFHQDSMPVWCSMINSSLSWLRSGR